MKTLPVKGKLCLCSVFHGLFSRPPTERATSGGKRAQTRTTGEKHSLHCGTWATGYRTGLLYPDTQINTPHVVKTSCVEFTVKRGRPARRPAIQLARRWFFSRSSSIRNWRGSVIVHVVLLHPRIYSSCVGNAVKSPRCLYEYVFSRADPAPGRPPRVGYRTAGGTMRPPGPPPHAAELCLWLL